MDEIIISADSHVIEVPDLWEKGAPQPLKEHAPKLYFDDKRDAWMFGSPNVAAQAVGGLFMAGQKPEEINAFRRAGFAVARHRANEPLTIDKPPSEYFRRPVYDTFLTIM